MIQASPLEAVNSPQGLCLRTLKDFRLNANLSQLRKATHLSAADWRVWAYLEEISGGDRKAHPFPPVSKVQSECCASRTTFYRAIAKLQECGFLELLGGAQ